MHILDYFAEKKTILLTGESQFNMSMLNPAKPASRGYNLQAFKESAKNMRKVVTIKKFDMYNTIS